MRSIIKAFALLFAAAAVSLSLLPAAALASSAQDHASEAFTFTAADGKLTILTDNATDGSSLGWPRFQFNYQLTFIFYNFGRPLRFAMLWLAFFLQDD